METLVDEIITEILSWLPVKSLVRFRCVSKSWNSLILHPTFVNLHLERSPKNANFVLSITIRDIFFYTNERDTRVVLCSKLSFMENPASTIAAQDGQSRLNYKYWVIGCCNGLLCLRGHFYGGDGDHFGEYWVRFWNPATRLRSKKSPHLCVDLRIFACTKFGFGYDKSSDTYKVVVILTDRNATEASKRTQVKVYTMGDNCWRDIQRFPAFPIIFQDEGIFFSGTLNWLAIQNFTPGYNRDTIAIDQIVIVSLDLWKETYKQMLLPRGLDETTEIEPNIGVLGDCLCLFHDYKETHFVVWQMKEFGVEESWTPFVNVSYEHLQIERHRWPWPERLSALPLCISENGDVLMLIGHDNYEIVLYYRRDNRVEHTDISKNRLWMDVKDFVPSMVVPC